MTPEDVCRMQGVAMAFASSARLNARVAGMQADNATREIGGLAPAYGEKAFLSAIEEEGAGDNQILMTVRPL
jgi:hypothetical protein